MNNANDYNFPLRTNFEARVFVIWVIASVFLFFTPLVIDVPVKIYWTAAFFSLVLSILLGRGGIEVSIKKNRLKGYKLQFMSPTSKEALKLFGVKDKEIIKNATRFKK